MTTFSCPFMSDMVIDTSTGDVCEGHFNLLYENYTYDEGSRTVISGISIACINGQYATLCNDGTNSPSAASVLCSAHGYYCELHVCDK